MHRSALLTLCALWMAGTAAAEDVGRDPASLSAVPRALGDTTQDLVFKPLPACRIVDTRVAGGPIAADAARSFLAVAVASGAGFASQGGSGTNCGTFNAGASAALLNVTVLAPTNAGNATVYKAGDPRPPTPSILYAAGALQSSQLVVPIPNPLAITDFTIHTSFAANFTVDIVGLFTVPQATALQCVGTPLQVITITADLTEFVFAPQCQAGYTPVMPYCSSGVRGVNLVGSGFDDNNPSRRTFCFWDNTTTASQPAIVGSLCCRVPGR